MTAITSLGGGHGLFATLRAVRRIADEVTAVVTVADDGGSSGRLRRELGQIPPGDLRMALAALSAEDERGKLWEEVLQHRFGGTGAWRSRGQPDHRGTDQRTGAARSRPSTRWAPAGASAAACCRCPRAAAGHRGGV